MKEVEKKCWWSALTVLDLSLPLPDSVSTMEKVTPAAAFMTRSLFPLCDTPFTSLKVGTSGQTG